MSKESNALEKFMLHNVDTTFLQRAVCKVCDISICFFKFNITVFLYNLLCEKNIKKRPMYNGVVYPKCVTF